jgi:hypothetical protein
MGRGLRSVKITEESYITKLAGLPKLGFPTLKIGALRASRCVKRRSRMPYRRITVEMVVNEYDTEVVLQAVNDAMDRIEQRTTVYSTDIRDSPTTEPENADEIAAPAK